jgi:regulation of enolase protein 1 (concanavalin A-like superfamily)
VRVYYGGVPQFIQVAQHFFMESALLEFFATAKVFGWYDSLYY